MTWRNIDVAPEGTHHLQEGVPLYDNRFEQVLAFHEPGLAPVQDGEEAWHIRVDGSPAYHQRHLRTYGFYEDLAAVVDRKGWLHIRPDGSPIYASRFDWCGNFQGGRCTVREHDGGYLHITPEGDPAYVARWRYAGDFRRGIAVVQSDNGFSTHIDRQGNLVHNAWFLDLDVFHKGFARARDHNGWMHINATGSPAYERRFAAVEPFYNNQARVERYDGGLEVIAEDGQLLRELRPALRSEFAALSADLVGFWRTQTIRTAVELGVFEAMPGSSDDIAGRCGLVRHLAGRLMRGLAELRLTRKIGEEWVTTGRGNYLKGDHPWTLAGAASEYARLFTHIWDALPKALKADNHWQAPNVFDQVASDPDHTAAHHRMLMSYALHDYTLVPKALELRGNERIIDAGGGLGALAQLLVNEYPKLQVVLLDRPEVIEQASLLQLDDRVKMQEGDIFWPWGVEGDAVVMARVLHDWDDSKSLQLLCNARGALQPGGRLFLVEMLLPEDGYAGGLCDLHLLLTTGGKERTAAEYEALLHDAGFDLKEIRRIPALPSIIMGVAR
jgi:2-polyprenyl-3-methyl-5-hydroxy-6-metoxy-1,4-benzoquinol methylase